MWQTVTYHTKRTKLLRSTKTTKTNYSRFFRYNSYARTRQNLFTLFSRDKNVVDKKLRILFRDRYRISTRPWEIKGLRTNEMHLSYCFLWHTVANVETNYLDHGQQSMTPIDTQHQKRYKDIKGSGYIRNKVKKKNLKRAMMECLPRTFPFEDTLAS